MTIGASSHLLPASKIGRRSGQRAFPATREIRRDFLSGSVCCNVRGEIRGCGNWQKCLAFLGSPCHRPQNLNADAERLIAIRSPAAMSGVTVQIGTSRKQTLARGESSAPCAPRACEKSRPIFKEKGAWT